MSELTLTPVSSGNLNFSNSPVTIAGGGTSDVPLTVRGASGQTANLLVLEQNDGTDVVTFGNDGAINVASGAATILRMGRSDAGDVTPDFKFGASDWTLYVKALAVGEIADVADILIRRVYPDAGAYNQTPAQVPDGVNLGYLAFESYDGSAFVRNTAIGSKTVGAAVSGANAGGQMLFYTVNQNDSTASRRERLVLNHDGTIEVRSKTNAAGTSQGSKENLLLTDTTAGTGLTIGGTGASTNWYLEGAAGVLKTDATVYAVGKLFARVGSASDQIGIGNNGAIEFGSPVDVVLGRLTANQLYLATGDALHVGLATDAGGNYIQFFEQTTDPAAGAANTARLFAKDNGAGKTQLVVRFASGATQVIATEP